MYVKQNLQELQFSIKPQNTEYEYEFRIKNAKKQNTNSSICNSSSFTLEDFIMFLWYFHRTYINIHEFHKNFSENQYMICCSNALKVNSKKTWMTPIIERSRTSFAVFIVSFEGNQLNISCNTFVFLTYNFDQVFASLVQRHVKEKYCFFWPRNVTGVKSQKMHISLVANA